MQHGARTGGFIALFCLAACGRLGVELVAVSGPGPVPEDPDSGSDQGALSGDAGASEEGTENADGAAPRDDASAVDTGADAGDDSGFAQDGATAPDAAPASLALRYDFSGTGSTVEDRVGSAHGVILGGALLDGSGSLTLDGTNDFVNMPNGLISRWSSVTVMTWLTWNGGACWQRIFDFGSSSNGEDNVGDATSAFSLSPSSCPNNVATGLFELSASLRASNGNALARASAAQVALVLDGVRGVMTVYVNGVQGAETAVPWQLSQLNDVNNWLGRSQWMQDKFLDGSLDELRIYGAALSAQEIAAAYARGANVP